MHGSLRPLSLALVPLLVGLAASHGRADDGAEGTEPAGAVYRNERVGLRAVTPPGWRLVADREGGTSWNRLATFFDPQTDVEAVLSARSRTHGTLETFYASVKRDWEATPEFTVTTMQRIEASGRYLMPRVLVEATYVHRPPAPSGATTPPPPVTIRVRALYLLAPAHELLLYAKGQSTRWSRAQAALGRLERSLELPGVDAAGPQGEGAYRNDDVGFSCRFPKDYAVIVPQRVQHVVQFEGVSPDAAALGVYRFPWRESLDADADRLARYYREDLGGEASAESLQVGAREGRLVTAKAVLAARDTTILLALVKRGDEMFRLRATMPTAREAEGRKAFEAFVSSFELGAAPR